MSDEAKRLIDEARAAKRRPPKRHKETDLDVAISYANAEISMAQAQEILGKLGKTVTYFSVRNVLANRIMIALRNGEIRVVKTY